MALLLPKPFLLLAALLAAFLLLSSLEASAGELAGQEPSGGGDQSGDGFRDAKYPYGGGGWNGGGGYPRGGGWNGGGGYPRGGGWNGGGGYPRGGGWNGGGYCRFGCCGYGYGGRCQCCYYAGEVPADAALQRETWN